MSETVTFYSQVYPPFPPSRVVSVGDPTVFGNLPPAPNIAAAVKTVIDGGKHSGYGHSRGKPFTNLVLLVHMHYTRRQEACMCTAIAIFLQVYQRQERPWPVNTVLSMVPH